MSKSGVKAEDITMISTSKSVWFYIINFIKIKKINFSHLKVHLQITIFTHLKHWFLYLLSSCFYTQSTRSITTTIYKLI